ncbi:MAG: citrate/2-methylcitrate synthase [Clostridia bacterium]|nr:citrate/2-methylcitrate synthase [Clostridia bacterium]MBR2398031.1 citrate/2-methylcitrate synthase [Clostridia bacterium]
MNEINYSEITPYVKKQAEISDKNNGITREMYIENDVKRGLRDLNGKGVVAGLTEVSHIKAKEIDKDGNEVPCEGELYYRGIDVKEITKGFLSENRHGFEETVYLLLFSKLPTYEELEEFKNVLSYYRTLPPSFVRDMILKAPGKNMMNIISRSVLALYAYDENPDDTSTANVLRQALQLIAQFPLLSVYGYQSFQHYHNNKSLFIHHPKPEYDTAENILYILRENGEFTPLEAKVLDTALVLHAEHGGGNNSTFTTHVVTSSATDTYSAISAALGSLKGPRHGGANVKVVEMFDDMKKCVDVKNKEEVRKYLIDVVEKNAFDKSGLIYGIGHAVYSKSDPRADVLHEVAKALSVEKGMEEEFKLYEYVERIAPEIIATKRKIYKGVSANVDFYSGLVYKMLDLPYELYTPIFAVSRIAGWCAHRIEELQNAQKIIRPAYINVKNIANYKKIDDRN